MSMFKLAEQNQVRWPVTVQVPQDGGTVRDVEIGIDYRLLTKAEAASIKNMPDALAETRMLDHVVGWDDRVVDTDGKPVPFSRDNLLALLEYDFVARAVVLGLYQASRGAPAKN